MSKDDKRNKTGSSASVFLHKIACLAMSLFFMYSAYVQLNDPDWFRWGSYYLACRYVVMCRRLQLRQQWISPD